MRSWWRKDYTDNSALLLIDSHNYLFREIAADTSSIFIILLIIQLLSLTARNNFTTHHCLPFQIIHTITSGQCVLKCSYTNSPLQLLCQFPWLTQSLCYLHCARYVFCPSVENTPLSTLTISSCYGLFRNHQRRRTHSCRKSVQRRSGNTARYMFPHYRWEQLLKPKGYLS